MQIHKSPCGVKDIPLLLREGKDERKVTIYFLVVLCKSAFSSILERSFLETFDAVVSHIHLKVKYCNNVGKQIVIDDDLRAVRHIHDDILRNLLTTTTVLEEDLGELNMVDLDVRGDEIRLVMNGDIEVTQLDNNPAVLVKVWA